MSSMRVRFIGDPCFHVLGLAPPQSCQAPEEPAELEGEFEPKEVKEAKCDD